MLFVLYGTFSSIDRSFETVQKSSMAVSNRHFGKEVPDLLESLGKMSQNTRFGSYVDEAKLKFPVNVIPDSLRVSMRLAFKNCLFGSAYAWTILYQLVPSGPQIWVPFSVRLLKPIVRAEMPDLAKVG